MVSKRQLLFIPTDIEEEFIDTPSFSWSEFCHKNLKNAMSSSKQQKWNDIQLPLILILFSAMLVIIAISNLSDWIVIYICYVLSAFTFSFGVFSIVWSLRKK